MAFFSNLVQYFKDIFLVKIKTEEAGRFRLTAYGLYGGGFFFF